MTRERLNEIKARLAAATPGPWKMSHRHVHYANVAPIAGVDESCGLGWEFEGEHVPEEPMRGTFSKGADAALIHHLHEDMAALIEAVEQQRAHIRALAQERDNAKHEACEACQAERERAEREREDARREAATCRHNYEVLYHSGQLNDGKVPALPPLPENWIRHDYPSEGGGYVRFSESRPDIDVFAHHEVFADASGVNVGEFTDVSVADLRLVLLHAEREHLRLKTEGGAK